MRSNIHPELALMSRLRQVAFLEGATLILLSFVAVPLKHWGDTPIAVSVLGPIHGLVFVAYLVTLMQTAAECRWRARDVVLLVATSLLPFGSIIGSSLLRRRVGAHLGQKAKPLLRWPR